MTGSRADAIGRSPRLVGETAWRRGRAVFWGPLIAAGLLIGAMPVAAQVGPPIRLGPPVDDATTPVPPPQPLSSPLREVPDAAPAAPRQPVAPPSDPAGTGGGVTVRLLDRVTVDQVGTRIRGLVDLPADLWADTPGDVVERLVALLPASPASHALRDLQLALLVSPARAPTGTSGSGALLEARLDRMLAMGALDAIGEVGQGIPSASVSAGIARVLTDRAFALGLVEEGCRHAAGRAGSSDDIYWIKAGIVCDAQAGAATGIELAVTLLAELGSPDPLLADLAQATATGTQAGATELRNAQPVHLAMAVLSGTPLAPDVSTIGSLPVLVGLARGVGDAPFDARLRAAERAERAGAIEPGDLTGVYAEVSVPLGGLSDAAPVAKADPGPHARALLWRVAEQAASAAEKAGAVETALEIAEDDAGYRQTARLFAPLVAGMRPAPDVADFVPTAIRVLVAAGAVDQARPWALWLSDRAGQNRASREAWWSLWPVMRVAGGDTLAAFDPAVVADWWRRLRIDERGTGPVRAATTLAILDAFGDPVPASVWRSLAGAPGAASHDVPSPAYRYGLAVAARSGRVGEGLLLALDGLGDSPLPAIAPDVTAEVVRALSALGLQPVARHFAGEAAIAYGL